MVVVDLRFSGLVAVFTIEVRGGALMKEREEEKVSLRFASVKSKGTRASSTRVLLPPQLRVKSSSQMPQSELQLLQQPNLTPQHLLVFLTTRLTFE